MAAGILDLSLTDYAKGGATSGAVPAVAVVPAGLANNSMPVSVEIPSTMEQVSRKFQRLLHINISNHLIMCNWARKVRSLLHMVSRFAGWLSQFLLTLGFM